MGTLLPCAMSCRLGIPVPGPHGEETRPLGCWGESWTDGRDAEAWTPLVTSAGRSAAGRQGDSAPHQQLSPRLSPRAKLGRQASSTHSTPRHRIWGHLVPERGVIRSYADDQEAWAVIRGRQQRPRSTLSEAAPQM